MKYRHLIGLLLLSLLFSGCGRSSTLIISDQAFANLAGESLRRSLDGKTTLESFSSPPTVQLVVDSAGSRGADALLFSPLFYRLAADVAPLLPDIDVYAAIPPGTAAPEGIFSVSVDPAEAAELVLSQIASQDGAGAADSVLMLYRTDFPGWRELALSIEEGKGAVRGPDFLVVPFREDDLPESLVAGIAGETYSVILVFGGSGSSEIIRNLSNRYPRALYISDSLPPPGNRVHGVRLELDWGQLYALLLAGDTSSGSWRLSPF